MPIATTVADVIAGEAVSGTPEQRWNDMVHIASVIQNRAAMLGVSPEDVVSVNSQFNAYGNRLPPGTSALTDMAQQAMDYVAVNGPVTDATYYATPAAADNLPGGLQFTAQTDGHQYFTDPRNRGIITAAGALAPDPTKAPALASADPLQAALTRPVAANGLLNGVTAATAPFATPTAVPSLSMPSITADPAFGANGLLTGKPLSIGDVAPVDASAMGSLSAGSAMPATASAGLLGVLPSAQMNVGSSFPASGSLGSEVAKTDRNGSSTSNFDTSRFADPIAANFDARFSAPEAAREITAQNFDARMNSPVAAAQSSAFDPGNSYFSPTQTAFDQSRFGNPAIDVATNTQSFMDPSVAPSPAPAATMMAANPAPAALLSSTATPSVNAYAQEQAQPAGVQAINAIAPQQQTGLLSSPTSLSQVNTLSAPGVASIAAPTVTPTQSFTPNPAAGNTFVGPTATATATANMPSVVSPPPGFEQPNIATDPGVISPSLPPASIPNEPSVIAGPTTTPASVQQVASPAPAPPTTSPTASATAQKPGLLASIMPSKETLAGGLLGGAVAGPVGGLLGALAGRQINQAGGLTGLLGNAQPFSVNNIGSGLSNIASIYGGGSPMGTQATANNGGLVTSLGNGYTAYTNPYGVTTVTDSYGNHMADWSGRDYDTAPGAPTGGGTTGTGTSTGGLFG